nr:hypothetical protein CFP56_15686 [Quercus suber]
MLDDGFGRIIASECENGTVLCEGLQDGNHKFEVCPNGSQGVGCGSYNWTVDTVPPTANITASTNFTNALNVSINISFSEPCIGPTGGGSFLCSSVNDCNLLVYGDGNVIPTSLETPQPNLQYSILVDLSSTTQYGRVILVMDMNFCTDSAGNKFERNKNSNFTLRFDRRSMVVNLTTHVPERQLDLNGETRLVAGCIPGMAIVTIRIDENSIISRQGTPVSQVDLITFLFDSVPIISIVISTLATASFVATSIAAGLLTASTASLSSIGTFSPPFSSVSDPASNLFRMAGHIQVFALSTWLGVTLPVEYYEFARRLQWSIPYFNLPWETGHTHSSPPANSLSFRSKIHDSGTFPSVQQKAISKLKQLNANEYIELFKLQNSGRNPNSDGWEDFSRTMFWLAIIGGSLILLHALLLAILKFKKQKQRSYGVLAFPRFEIFLVNLAVPSICEASAALIRGGKTSGIVVGTLILVAVSFLLLDLLWFLSTGITFAKRVLYNEDNQVIQVGQRNLRIARLTLGPGNRGQWTWRREQNFDCLTMLGPLFEDLRGPIALDDETGVDSGGTDLAPLSSAQSMSRSTRPSHIPPTRSSTVATPAVPSTSNTSAHTHGDYQIIAPDGKTKEVEVSGGSVSSIQYLFMQLRIYYTLIESVRRVMLGALGGAYKNTWSSTIPVIILLCITSLQLFFLVLEKPFIKRRVQLVEIISVASEVCVFALTLVLLDKKLSSKQETIAGVSMLVLFLMGFLPQIVNELYALRRQIKQLDTTNKRFRIGLRIASFGILLFFFSQESLNYNFPDCFGDKDLNETVGEGGEESTNVTGNQGDEDPNVTDSSIGLILLFIPHKFLESRFPVNGHHGDGETNVTSSSAERNRNSGSRNSGTTVPEQSWLKQLRELAKASFSKDESGAPSDPSTSRARWSGFWGTKGSGSPTLNASSDFKWNPSGLYNDLEAIFASK